MTKIAMLASRLGDIPMITNEKAVKAKSRDFFWYSPILKEQLDQITAEAVVVPRTEAEVVITLAACFELDIPVTPRGGGTGNYGQAMPLKGGVVLDHSRMDVITKIEPGRLTCQPGALMGQIDLRARAESGQELRMHPSTLETATIGGFIAGGSGGVGSIRFGLLFEPGNIRRLRIATCEAAPRLLDLTGEDINLVHHAYGVTGVIAEVEMPLTDCENWVEVLLAFDDWNTCVAQGWSLAHCPALLLKQLAAIQSPAPHRYFTRHRKFLLENDNLLCVLVSESTIDGLLARSAGKCVFRSDKASTEEKQGLPHLHHLCWNHTTLRALKIDPEMTYLQLGPRDADAVASVMDLARLFPNEIINHVEFTRSLGVPRLSMLPMVRFSDKARLDQIIATLDEIGIKNWNPHVFTLEEGNYRGVDPGQVAFKRSVDPKGLLNPGKLIGWDKPDYIYDPKGGYSATYLKDRNARPDP